MLFLLNKPLLFMTLSFPEFRPSESLAAPPPVRKSRKNPLLCINKTASTMKEREAVARDQLVQHAYQARDLRLHHPICPLQEPGRQATDPTATSMFGSPRRHARRAWIGGFHDAAHSSMTAGMRDNRREQIMKEIAEQGQ